MVRAVVLASSAEAVRATSNVLSACLPSLRVGVSSRWSHGSSIVFEGSEGTTVEIVEISWLSRWRQLRRAPAFGTLLSLGWGDSFPTWYPAAFDAFVSDVPRSRPKSVVDLSPPRARPPTASSRLREVVLSTTGVEKSALEVEKDAEERGAKPVAPGVWKIDSATMLRLQPLDSGTSALVFHCDDVDEAARHMENASLGYSRVGRSGFDPGQLSLHLPWTKGLEMRLCQRKSDNPRPHFCESHRAILNAPDVLPELQSPFLAGSDQQHQQPNRVEGDCWKETRATLRHRLLGKKRK